MFVTGRDLTRGDEPTDKTVKQCQAADRQCHNKRKKDIDIQTTNQDAMRDQAWRKTKKWGDIQADIVDMAYELGVDPQMIGDFDNLMMTLLQAMVDMAMQQYQSERPMPAM